MRCLAPIESFSEGAGVKIYPMKLLQFILDRAEGFATRRRWVGLTFRILQLKRTMGLRFER